ncbi:MAG TPA: ABC transporter permease [Gammaproteobacteria bacterium]|nr:ABC transporter permease [Gammaproteobacteria bacterium]
MTALIRKESYQLFRDPSTIAIGIVMPLILVLLFGYGLSLDVAHVPVAIVLQDTGQDARELAARFELSPYFDARFVSSLQGAERLMVAHEVGGIVQIRADFSRRLQEGNAEVQVLVNGTEANTARIVEAYAQGAVAAWTANRAAKGLAAAGPPLVVQSRLRFNEANDSHYFLVPGLIVLVMTLLGAFMTALVMAREWERGTFEALFVTPVRADEILLSKIVPYFALGFLGLLFSIAGSKFLFHVPLRGSIWILVCVSMLYLLVALGIGLVVSAVTKSQFIASQIALLVTFLPAMMLSGFLFDLHGMPAAVRAVTYLLPARYYVALLQTLFLAGNVWGVILPNAAVLFVMAAAMMLLSRAATRKKLA